MRRGGGTATARAQQHEGRNLVAEADHDRAEIVIAPVLVARTVAEAFAAGLDRARLITTAAPAPAPAITVGGLAANQLRRYSLGARNRRRDHRHVGLTLALTGGPLGFHGLRGTDRRLGDDAAPAPTAATRRSRSSG